MENVLAAPVLEDGALVRRALAGADWARRVLFQRHVGRVLAFLTRLLGSTADAEDATQDCFVEAFRDLHKLRVGRDFGRWVLGIAEHQAQRRFRRPRLLSLQEPTPVLEALVDEQQDPSRQAELWWLQKRLARLQAPERTAWVLRHFEELELTEVAQALGVSLATAKRWLAAAAASLARFSEGPG